MAKARITKDWRVATAAAEMVIRFGELGGKKRAYARADSAQTDATTEFWENVATAIVKLGLVPHQ